MRLRHNERILLPDSELAVQKDDRFLFCGTPAARRRMAWTLQNENALGYILTGEAGPEGWVWRRFKYKGTT